MTTDELTALENEETIVWLVDPATLPFVRVKFVPFGFKGGQPKFYTDGVLAGYSTLKSTTQRPLPFRFSRRIFFLTAKDLLPDCPYRLHDSLPGEGVRPLSIRPCYWGDR